MNENEFLFYNGQILLISLVHFPNKNVHIQMYRIVIEDWRGLTLTYIKYRFRVILKLIIEYYKYEWNIEYCVIP